MNAKDKSYQNKSTIVLPVILLVDASGSMDAYDVYGGWTKMETVQRAFLDIARLLVEYQQDDNVEVKVSVLCFHTDTEWLCENVEPEKLFNVHFTPQGVTCMGDAFQKLEKKLNSEELGLEDVYQYKPTVMILLTDGGDAGGGISSQEGIQILRQNHWFAKGLRIVIAVGDDIDVDMETLQAFTGSQYAVIKVDQVMVLQYLLERSIDYDFSDIALDRGAYDVDIESIRLRDSFNRSARETGEIIQRYIQDKTFYDVFDVGDIHCFDEENDIL